MDTAAATHLRVEKSPVPDIDLLAVHAANPLRYPVLLESLGSLGADEHYDLLLAHPAAWMEDRGGRLTTHGWAPPAECDFFEALSAWAACERIAPCAGLPFCGGWFVFLGYEAGQLIERDVRWRPAPAGWPDALAVRCTAAVVRRHATGELLVVAETPSAADGVAQDLLHVDALPPRTARVGEIREDDPEIFLDGARRVLEYLRAGDAFQVNLSRAWHAPMRGFRDYLDLYRSLRRHNPAPFAGLAAWDGAAILSSSPERLLRVDRDVVTTEPIAGTRPRDPDPTRDVALRAALATDLKERAEHLMLIDLERNDLGRVCETGSVTVPELMRVRSHAHVHHIVSKVQGRLRSGLGPGAALKAVFPGGTITGCPKVRVMQIIAELEREGRGPYTGSMGYLSRCGRLDMNILIRSLVCARGAVTLRAGAGIVADSNPARELVETRAKARGLLLALGARP